MSEPLEEVKLCLMRVVSAIEAAAKGRLLTVEKDLGQARIWRYTTFTPAHEPVATSMLVRDIQQLASFGKLRFLEVTLDRLSSCPLQASVCGDLVAARIGAWTYPQGPVSWTIDLMVEVIPDADRAELWAREQVRWDQMVMFPPGWVEMELYG